MQAVDVFELGAEHVTDVDLGVTVYAEEDLAGSPRVQVVIHHEIQQLPVAFPDLIRELSEGYAARDQPLASLAWPQLSQAPIGVSYDESRSDVRDPHLLIRHYGPFLAP